MENLFKDFGRSFIVSSLLPASVFVILGVFLFNDLVPSYVVAHLKSLDTLYGNIGIVFALLTLWLGFILYSNQEIIFKVYEGYHLPKWLKKILKDNKIDNFESQCPNFQYYQFLTGKKHSVSYSEIFDHCSNEDRKLLFLDYSLEKQKILLANFTLAEQKEMSAYLEDKISTEVGIPSVKKIEQEIEIKKKEIFARVYDEISDHYMKMPMDQDEILPTRLGNVLRASERYSNQRYGLDGVVAFPRLVQVVPKQFTNLLEEQSNKLVFLLNSSSLFCMLGLISFFVGWIVLLQSKWPIIPLFLKISNENKGSHLIVIGVILFGWGYFLYRLGVVTAQDYIVQIQAGFDLYRFELLDQLQIKRPLSLHTEQKTWEKVNDLFTVGHHLGEINFRYQHRQTPPAD